MSRIYVGCCGAYCRTCRELTAGKCRGCKLGYENGERDLSMARCAMKRCCLGRLGTSHTCADCGDYSMCSTLRDFYGKRGYKYGKYRKAAEYIRQYGYDAFISEADRWKGPYGKLLPPSSKDQEDR